MPHSVSTIPMLPCRHKLLLASKRAAVQEHHEHSWDSLLPSTQEVAIPKRRFFLKHIHIIHSHICPFLITCSESHNLLSQLQVPSGALCTSLAGVVYSSVFTLEPEPTPTLLHLTHNRSRQMARLHCKKSCRWKPLKRTRLWKWPCVFLHLKPCMLR